MEKIKRSVRREGPQRVREWRVVMPTSPRWQEVTVLQRSVDSFFTQQFMRIYKDSSDRYGLDHA